MISLKHGTRIAEITLNKEKKKTKPVLVYIQEDEGQKTEISNKNKDELLPKSFYTSIKSVNSNGILLLKKAIRDRNPTILSRYEKLMTAYNFADEIINDLDKKYFSIPKDQGKLTPIPIQDSSRIAVFGPSGVGKSTWISSFMKKYIEYYPKNNIYVFSPKKDDEAFKNIKNLHYVKIDESILDEPLDVSEFKDSICCFDDIESITDKHLNIAITKFRNQCYEIGRSPSNITTIAVHHVILASEKTKIILNESDQVVLFPKSNFSQIESLCRRYYGMTKDQLNYIRDIPSRYVVVKRSYPTTILSENAVKIL